jgi:hypothetical protein
LAAAEGAEPDRHPSAKSATMAKAEEPSPNSEIQGEEEEQSVKKPAWKSAAMGMAEEPSRDSEAVAVKSAESVLALRLAATWVERAESVWDSEAKVTEAGK